MEKNKLPIVLILVLWVLSSLYVFIYKGVSSGYDTWQFYASLLGFIISIVFLILIIRNIKN
jgi:hypothetical protein